MRALQLAGRAATSLMILTGALFATPSFAQDETENPPTLKLDRIMSLPAFAGQTRAPAAPQSDYTVDTVVTGLTSPWALAFLPNGEILINENNGNMRIADAAGKLSSPLTGLPAISHKGWAGLFDVALDPEFANNHLVYFSYAAPGADADAPNIPRVARARLDRKTLNLTGVEVIVDGNGGQELHFAANGTLLVAGWGDDDSGDAQDLGTHQGKVLRLNSDGSVPDDNPWRGDATASAAIYTRGHRDISGYATHPGTGETWVTEHGARGGDEINILRAGANYGWPVISYGTEYSGAPVGSGHTVRDGMEQPLYFWRPSIAPSGLIFYTGDMFAEWRGNIFVSALSGQHLARLVLDGDRVVGEERLLVDRAARIREVRQGPDGALYVLTNEDSDESTGNSKMLRVSRAAR